MDSVSLGMSLSPWTVLPFAGFLLTVAIFPLMAPKTWSDHFGKISLVFGAPVALWFLFAAPGFGYIGYSGSILLPVFALVTWFFL